MLSKAFIGGAALALFSTARAQCPAGQSAVTIVVDTDAWGYEVYWEVVDVGAACGENPWAFGGNSAEVGCDGNGNANGSTTYPSNAIITDGPFCLPTWGSFDFIHIDDYGDGGTHFELASDGVLIGTYNGTGDGNVWTFSPGSSSMVPNDSPCDAAPISVDGDSVSVSTVGASSQIGELSPGANPMGGCGTQGWWCGSDGNAARTVWLTFSPATSDPVIINTCIEGTNMDTQLALYRATDCGDWSTFTLVGASDDIPGGCGPANGYASRLYSDCLEAGETYFIQVDGWGGSTGTAVVAVESNPNPTPTLNVMTRNIECPLSEEVVANGQILIALNGSGLGSSYSIEGPSFSSTEPYAGGLNPGTYTVSVNTACGAEFASSVTLTAPASFGFAFESVDPSCSGAADGAVEVTLTGGTAPYEFAWSNASGFESTAEDLIGLEEGWYDVDVTDAAGCLFEASVELVAGSSLEFSLGPDTLICMDQTLLLYGPPSLDYVWQDGSINQFLYIEASEWGVGTYPLYLIVSNDEGCEQSDVMILTIGSCTTGLVDEVSVAMGVYPNPASGRVQWRLPEGACSADVVDAAGRVVVTLTGAMGALDVSDWPVGTYFLKTQGLLGIQEVKRVQVVR